MNNEATQTTIALNKKTKAALDSIKHPGQTYDGMVQELVRFWKEKTRDYWTRRKREKTPVR